MPRLTKYVFALAVGAIIFGVAAPHVVCDEADALPPRLPKDQRENLLRFLRAHEKPDRYVPADAKIVDAQPADLPADVKAEPAKPIKQYIAQIVSHRPVPGEEEPKRVDVYYYRPNPEKGKAGITVKHTVDLTTGQQVGATEVLVKHHTPLSREELAEAVALAREKSPAVQALYKDRGEGAVQWEYLQMFVTRKSERQEPGERVVRLVFTAAAKEQPPAPIAVLVNLTKGALTEEPR